MIKSIIQKLKGKSYAVPVERIQTENDNHEYPKDIRRVLNLLNYTKKSATSYSAGAFNVGYHSFKLGEHSFVGQRNPAERLSNVPIDFKGKTVLDIGCNQGGMLHVLSSDIKYGIGIDYDSRMINAANKMKSYSKNNDLHYFVFDLEKEPLAYISDCLIDDKVDVVFLLSVCMWVENWKDVILYAKSISSEMVFESNGNDQQQKEQISYLEANYSQVNLVNEKSEDDSSQKNRMLYHCIN